MIKRKNTFLPVLYFLIITVPCRETKVNHSNIYADTVRIKKDLVAISKTPQSRNYLNQASLNSVADYIYTELSKTCDSVYFQTYKVNGTEYKNVVGVNGGYDNHGDVIFIWNYG